MSENIAGNRESVLSSLRARLATSLARNEVAAAALGMNARIRFSTDQGATDIFAVDGVVTIDVASGSPDVCISAPDSAWKSALEALPPPGFQSFTAWQISNELFTVSGEPLIIAQARPFLEMLVENLRTHWPQPEVLTRRSFEGVVGKYHQVTGPSGIPIPIYTETAGHGRPLLCLHTAGADSRQYHGLMTDLGLCESWKIVAFDMPFHGRSLPPPDWAGARYKLDQASYLNWCVAFIEQVLREPVVVVGCSMGAGIAMVLAAERPDLVSGLIALEAPLRPRGRRNPYLTHVAVHGGMHAAAYVRGLMAPSSPTRDRTVAPSSIRKGRRVFMTATSCFTATSLTARRSRAGSTANQSRPISLLAATITLQLSRMPGSWQAGLKARPSLRCPTLAIFRWWKAQSALPSILGRFSMRSKQTGRASASHGRVGRRRGLRVEGPRENTVIVAVRCKRDQGTGKWRKKDALRASASSRLFARTFTFPLFANPVKSWLFQWC